jgi:hypothetical protein
LLDPCPEGCKACWDAAGLFIALVRLEGGAAVPTGSAVATEVAALDAARQRSAALQRQLSRELLALTWRHPVPGVCGNVLCEQLTGEAAVGVVRSRVRTLCGGCGAAWYCCEECQSAAWAAHRHSCR